MKRNTRRHIPSYHSAAVQGFTLLELLVASVLAMIVIVAASGTYMITRKLNNSAQERISVQQDIRNASVQMARDARMAGTFGCYTMADNDVPNKGAAPVMKPSNADVQAIVELNESQKDGFGVRLVPKNTLSGIASLGGLSEPSDGLLFIYGQGTSSVKIPVAQLGPVDSTISELEVVGLDEKSNDLALLQTLSNQGDLILSNCNAIKDYHVSGYNAPTKRVTVTNGSGATITGLNVNNAGDATVSKFYASLYVLGKINSNDAQWTNEKALLRYEIGANGAWQGPQLLATGIDDTDGKGMTFAFGYVDATNGCKTGNTASGVNEELFSFVSDPKDAIAAVGNKLPAIVQLRLKYFVTKYKSGKQATDSATRDYIINTTVRAGNTCVNRLM